MNRSLRTARRAPAHQCGGSADAAGRGGDGAGSGRGDGVGVARLGRYRRVAGRRERAHRRGHWRRGGHGHDGRGGGAHPCGRGGDRALGRRQDGGAAACRGRHPAAAHAPHRLRACAGRVGRAAGRHRPQRPRHRRRRARAGGVGDRGGAVAIGRGRRLLRQPDDHRRPADRRCRLPRAWHSADRRCRGAAAAQGEPAPLHRHGRRPRGLLRRQGARRAAGLGHPGRPARPDWRRRCCSSSTWTWRPTPGRRRS